MPRRPYNKFGAVWMEVDGIKFRSKKEARRYKELKLLESAGEIASLELQRPFQLQAPFIDNHGERQAAIKYVCDFFYIDKKTGRLVVEDVKGFKTQEYKLKKKLFLRQFPQYYFYEV